MSIITQYDSIGKKYIRSKKEFYNTKSSSKKIDAARKHIISELKSFKGKKLLDLGCGCGDDLQIYLEKGADCYGIDPSKVMVSEARKNTKLGKRIKVENIEETSFDNEFFDLIVGRFSIHYLTSFDKAYKEIHRLLKKNGKALIVGDHPINGFAYQKEKKYGSHEIIELPIFHNRVTVRFPAHTFRDYLSSVFLNLFEIIRVYEEKKQFEGLNKDNIPNFIALTFKKKEKLPSH